MTERTQLVDVFILSEIPELAFSDEFLTSN